MKRSVVTTVLAFVLGVSTASQASACLCIPYIPFLDPFAWLGFYGCGNGYGGGGYGGGYGYAPQTPSYGYAPQQQYAYPMQMAPQLSPSCPNCTGAAPVPQRQAMAPVQVPVTTYKAVTQYVPQTTYQTQYRPVAPSVAYQPQAYTYQQAYGYQPAQVAYAAPAAPVNQPMTSPTTAYNGNIPSTAYATPSYATPAYTTPSYATQSSATSSYGTPYYSAPVIGMPSIASPVGDITGDHEWAPQAAQIPVIPNSHTGAVPARPAIYGTTPRAARTFSATVK